MAFCLAWLTAKLSVIPRQGILGSLAPLEIMPGPFFFFFFVEQKEKKKEKKKESSHKLLCN
jgi:hypothetical protein